MIGFCKHVLDTALIQLGNFGNRVISRDRVTNVYYSLLLSLKKVQSFFASAKDCDSRKASLSVAPLSLGCSRWFFSGVARWINSHTTIASTMIAIKLLSTVRLL